MGVLKYRKKNCIRCGKEIISADIPGMSIHPSYRIYGNICIRCLSDSELERLSLMQIEETAKAARRYLVARKINWKEEKFHQFEKEVLQYIAMKIKYTDTYPSMMEMMLEFPDSDISSTVAALEGKGFVKTLI